MISLLCLICFIAVAHCLIAVNVTLDFHHANGTVQSLMAVVDGVVQDAFAVQRVDEPESGFLLAPDVVNVTLTLQSGESDDVEFLVSRDVVGGESKPHHSRSMAPTCQTTCQVRQTRCDEKFVALFYCATREAPR